MTGHQFLWVIFAGGLAVMLFLFILDWFESDEDEDSFNS